jgi:hypothetical protein
MSGVDSQPIIDVARDHSPSAAASSWLQLMSGGSASSVCCASRSSSSENSCSWIAPGSSSMSATPSTLNTCTLGAAGHRNGAGAGRYQRCNQYANLTRGQRERAELGDVAAREAALLVPDAARYVPPDRRRQVRCCANDTVNYYH